MSLKLLRIFGRIGLLRGMTPRYMEIGVFIALIMAFVLGAGIFWQFGWIPTVTSLEVEAKQRLALPFDRLTAVKGALEQRDTFYKSPPAFPPAPDVFR